MTLNNTLNANQYNDWQTLSVEGIKKTEDEEILSDEAQFVSDAFVKAGLPPCNISFGNINALDLDMFNVEATPVNMKLFNKIGTFENYVRRINDKFITLIEAFNCCQLADKYNSTIKNSLEDTIKGFAKSLVSFAEEASKEYLRYKVVLCAVRPVPGNPWLKTGGIDFLSYIYSFLNGLEDFADWLMDGSIMDVLNDPLKNFLKKLETCTPVIDKEKKLYEIYLKTALQEVSKNNLVVLSNNNIDDNMVANIYSDKNIAVRDYSIALNNIKTIKSQMSQILLENPDENVDDLLEDLLMYEEDQYNAETKLLDLNEKIDLITLDSDVSYSQFQKNDNKVSNELLIQKNIEFANNEFNKPSCSCLLSILGATNITDSKDITISTQDDFDKLLKNKIPWFKKNDWVKILNDMTSYNYEYNNDLENEFQSLYISSIESFLLDEKLPSSFLNTSNRNKLQELDIFNKNLDKLEDLNFIYFAPNPVVSDYIDDIEYKDTFDNINILNSNFDLNYFKDFASNDNTGIKGVIDRNDIRKNYISNLEQLKLKLNLGINKIESIYREEFYNLRKQLLIIVNEYNVVDRVNNLELNTNSINTFKDNLIDQFEAQRLLNELGNTFDVRKFLNFKNTNTYELNINVQTYVWEPNINMDIPNNNYPLSDTLLWYQSQVNLSIINASIIRLQDIIKMDNYVVEIIGDLDDVCDCGLICRLIQALVDIIISSINNILQSLVKLLIQSIMNEKLSYILKFILSKYKCYLDFKATEDNLEKIKLKAKQLNQKFDIPFNEATDPLYCDQDNYFNDIDNAEIKMVNQNNNPNDLTQSIPMPSFGVIDNNDPFLNQNKLYFSDDVLKRTGFENANIPLLNMECINNNNPYIYCDIKDIENLNTYEMIIMFKPGDYINTDDEIITTISQENKDINNNETLNDSLLIKEKTEKAIKSLEDILQQAKDRVESIQNMELYIDNDCSSEDKFLKLCSKDNLEVNTLQILDGNFPITNNSKGTISQKQFVNYDEEFITFFPEHKDSDIYGFVKLESGSAYFKYTTPPLEILPERITVSETVIEDSPYVENSVETDIKTLYIDYKTDTITTITEIIYDEETKTKKIIITTKHNETYLFREANFEMLAKYKNKVNELNIRVIMDIINFEKFEESPIPYDENYIGRYPEYIDLGFVETGDSVSYYISEERLLLLAKSTLRSNFMLPSTIVDDALDAQQDLEDKQKLGTDECLLPNITQEKINKIESNINETLKSAADIEDMAKKISDNNMIDIEIQEEIKQVLNDLKRSLMFVMLNSDLGIAVQVINKKIYLQLPVDSLSVNSYIELDHILQPQDIYMLVISVQQNSITLKLLTEDKLMYEKTLLNIDNYRIKPEYIAGMPDKFESLPGFKTFCGLELIDVIFSNYNLSDKYYKRTIMNYVPRNAMVLFDYSDKNNSKIKNSITKVDDKIIINATSKENQYVSGYGLVLDGIYYQAYRGYMDGFFCKDNLTNISFTLMLWFKPDENLEGYNYNIISDDILKNYIYYNAHDQSINIDFIGSTKKKLLLRDNDWQCIIMYHDKYTKKYIFELTSRDYNIRTTESLYHNTHFNLMSVGAQYDTGSKQYINKFEGLFGPISIFLNDIDIDNKIEICKRQYIQIKGL